MTKKKTKKIERLKSSAYKAFSVVMSALMAVSGISTAGLRTVFAADGYADLGTQVTINIASKNLISSVWGRSNVSAYQATIGGTRIFSYSMTSADTDQIIYSDSAVYTESSSILSALNYYYQHSSDESYWVVQTLIWGYTSGSITASSDAATAAAQVQLVFQAEGIDYDESTIIDMINTISSYSSGNPYYIYTNTGGVPTFLGSSAGSVPAHNSTTVVTVTAEETVRRNESVTIVIEKTDVDTGNPLQNVEFKIYVDDSAIGTYETDADGLITVNYITGTVVHTSSISERYATNWSVLSPGNQTIVAEEGIYSNSSEAYSVAETEAINEATAACEADNTGAHVYKAEELSTRANYYLNSNDTVKSIPFTATYDSDTKSDGTVKFDYTNARQYGILTITKKDAEQLRAVAGAVYGLYASVDIYNPDGSGIVYEKDELVGTFDPTDASGNSTLQVDKNGEELYLGTYYLKEMEAPYGYTLSDTKTSVTLEANDTSVDHVLVTADVTDYSQTGKIVLTKTDDETGTVIAGAEFDLFAKNDIEYPDGSGIVWKNAGDKIASVTTDANGQAEIENLYLGDYYFVETSTIAPYYCNPQEQAVSIVYAGQEEAVSVVTPNLTNHRQEGMITVTSTDEETGNPVAGAVYELYAAEDIYSADGTVLEYSEGDLVGTFPATDLNGEAYLDQLYLGKYIVIQKTAADGYIYKENRSEVTLSYEGMTVSVTTEEASGSNKVQRGTITITKEDRDLNEKNVDASVFDFNSDGAQGDATLEGATYGLYAKNDITYKDAIGDVVLYDDHTDSIDQITISEGTDLTVYDEQATAGTLIATAKTDENGRITFDHLYLGDYYVKEVEPSEGYQLSDDSYDVTLSYAGQDVEITDAATTVLESVNTQAISVHKIGSVEGIDSSVKNLKDVHFEIKLESDIQSLVSQGMSLEEAIAAAPLYDEIITDKDGNATSSRLPYGTYRVTETMTNQDYVACDDFFVTITENSEDPQQYTNDINNDYFFANVRISKHDSETGKTVLRANAEFRIKAITTCYLDGREFEPGEYVGYYTWDSIYGTWVDSWTTDANGIIDLDGHKLSAGTYSLEEIHAPYDYVVNEEGLSFTITTGYSEQTEAPDSRYIYGVNDEKMYPVDDEGNAIFYVEFEDDPEKAQITIDVQGDILIGYEDGQFIYEMGGLADATFTIRAASDIMDPANDGEILYSAGDTVVDKITTNRNGTITTDELPLGEYVIEQISAPYGYVIDTESQTLNFVYVNETTPVVPKTAEFTNEYQQHIVTTTKLDKETGEGVAGATFTMYADEDIYNAYGDLIVEKDSSISTAISGLNGEATFDIKLPIDCTYYVKETAAPLGYVSNTAAKESFNTNYTNDDHQLTVPIANSFVNAPTTTEITKIDATTGVKIGGAILQILDSDGNVVDEWTTVQDDTHIIKRLYVGETYSIHEYLAAYGYVQADDVYFVVEDTEEVQKHTMEDELVKGQITVAKSGDVLSSAEMNDEGNIDFGYAEHVLEGATYNVFAAEDIKHPDNESDDFFKEGDLVDTITTGEDGTATTCELPLGKYTVCEVTAPQGFIINTEEKDTELVYEGQNKPLVASDVAFSNDRQLVEVSLTKVDRETGEALEGVEFTMYANKDITNFDGDILLSKDDVVAVARTDEEGKLTFAVDLPIDLDSLTTGYESEDSSIHGDPDSMFYIKETRRIFGYASIDDIVYVDTSYVGQEVDVNRIATTLTNLLTRTTFSLADIDTGNLVAGSMLEIIPVLEDGTVDEDNVFASWTTSEEGHVVKGLEPGQTYVLRHTLLDASSQGYVSMDDMHFTIDDTEDMQFVTMGIDHTHTSFDLVNVNGDMIEGAAMQIVDGQGNIMDEWTTDGSSHSCDYLPIGTYTLVEKSASDGYVKALSVEFTVEDTAEVQSYSMTNKQARYSLTDLEGNRIAGAVLNAVDSAGKVVDTWTTTTSVHAISGLTEGQTYTIVEVSAPEGYIIAPDETIEISTDKKNESFSMTNNQLMYSLKDTDGKDVIGSVLQVLDEQGNVLDEWETDGSAHAVSGLRIDGSYVIRQASVDNIYVRLADTEFTVETATENIDMELVNSQFALSFKDVDGNYIVGATLQVLDEDGNVVDEWVTEACDHDVLNLVEGKEYILHEAEGIAGYVYIDDITFVPELFKNEDDTYLADIEVEFLLTKVVITVLDKETGLPITGLDCSFGIYSDPECTQLIKEVHIDTETGTVTFDAMRFGTYYVKQITAPDGYVLSDEILTVIIDSELDSVGIVYNAKIELEKIEPEPEPVEEVVVVVEEPDDSDTGDSSSIAAASLMSLLAVAAACIVRRKKATD